MKNKKIINFQSYLNKEGNIDRSMAAKDREYAAFLALVIDSATDFTLCNEFETDIRCFSKGCKETIQAYINIDENYHICWFCIDCDAEGEITGWEGTRWDNSTEKLTTYDVVEIR